MLMKSEKGQTSFEVIIITTVVIVMVTVCLSTIPPVMVTTAEIAVLKSETLRLLSEEGEFCYIANIKEPVTFTGTDEITIVIDGCPVPAQLKTDIMGVEQDIIDLGLASDVEIYVEEAP